MTRVRNGVAVSLLTLILVGCGGGTQPAPTSAPAAATSPAAPTAATAAQAELRKATFAKSLGENQEPIDPVETFSPTDTVYFSLEFAGRPTTGKVKAIFYWKDQQIAEATADFADANSGVFFSLGESTFAGFNLSTSEILPISANYRVEAFLDEQPLGEFPFAIVPPADAVPSRISKAELARGTDEAFNPIDPTTLFTPEETVYIVGGGDFGLHSWLQAEWYVNGTLDEQGTRSLTMQENAEATGFNFSFVPEGGWPTGEHEVVLTLNDQEIGRYGFSVSNEAYPTAGPITSGPFDVDLSSFEHPSGVFSLDRPSSWEGQESSGSGAVAYLWSSPEGDSALFVVITEVEPEVIFNESQLGDQALNYATSSFGDTPGFVLGEPETQADGRVRVVWEITPEIAGTPTKLIANTYAEQRGNKISVLTVVIPENTLAAGSPIVDAIVNSYQINPDAAVPQE